MSTEHIEALRLNTEATWELAALMREELARRDGDRLQMRTVLRVRAESGDIESIELLERLGENDPFWRDDAD